MEHTLTTHQLIRIETIIRASALSEWQSGEMETAFSRGKLGAVLAAIYDDAQNNEDVTIKVIREAPTAI